jgi:hypothetical protein
VFLADVPYFFKTLNPVPFIYLFFNSTLGLAVDTITAVT